MSECPLRTDTELLTRLTSHNPLIPLPTRSWPNRNPKIAHAPKRNHGLSAEGKQVSAFLLPSTRQQSAERKKTRPYLFYTLLWSTILKAVVVQTPNQPNFFVHCTVFENSSKSLIFLYLEMRHILWLLQTLCTTKKALLKELGLLFVSELLAFRFFSLKCNFSGFFQCGKCNCKKCNSL